MPNIISPFTMTTSGVSTQSRLVDKTKPPQATRTITTFGKHELTFFEISTTLFEQDL